MLLKKHLTLTEVQLKIDGDAGTFSGYASVFGGVDSYGDTIIKGAFESTLRQNGRPKMFYNHEWDMPIGKYLVAREDDHGLFVQGEFTPGLARSADVRAAMKHETLDGLSIGGFLKKGDYEDTEGGRIIRKWTQLVEVSPVVFPADRSARIDAGSVKGADLLDVINATESIRDIEVLLRDVAGLNKAAAIALVARVKLVLGQGDPAEAQSKAIRGVVERIERLRAAS